MTPLPESPQYPVKTVTDDDLIEMWTALHDQATREWLQHSTDRERDRVMEDMLYDVSTKYLFKIAELTQEKRLSMISESYA